MKLLAILVGAKSAPACLDAAAVAARTLGDGSIEALNVLVDPEHIVAPSEEVEFQRLRERREGKAQERAAATHAAFASWQAQADGPAVEWRSVVGTEEETVRQEAQQADVVVLVLAREGNLDSGDALHASIYRSGKPVLLVPIDWRRGGRTRFEHVVVALSDSEAARHAIRGASTMMRRAARVTALRIGMPDDRAVELIALLREAGIDPELRIVAPSGKDLGAQIVAEAKALGADLLVAGAYRHSEMVEWLIGGTTRHMLAAADLPLLLAH